MTGGRRFQVVRDAGGVEHARIHVTLHREEDLQWMNPGFAEIGYTVPAGLEGDWYVFATLRSGATAELDPTGAYFGIYNPWFSNGIDMHARGEIANYPITARQSENGQWRTVCLGKRRLFPGARLWVMPGILKEAEYVDVREFALVPPALVEKSTPGARDAKDTKDGAAAKARSIVVDWRAFDRAPNVRVQEDRIDSFKYARLAAFDTNAPVESVSWTVKPAEAGEWDVFAKVRIGAAFAFDYDATTASVTIPAARRAGGNAAQTPVQDPARVHITGCEVM
ncbi:MAG: hypothetical protein GX571_11005 [Lentisphaerae bacterium]|nr:hypothetical protein [Lentisphaerota bacterium]